MTLTTTNVRIGAVHGTTDFLPQPGCAGGVDFVYKSGSRRFDKLAEVLGYPVVITVQSSELTKEA